MLTKERLRAAAHGERGIGLVELLVVITILAVVGGIFAAGAIAGMRTTRQADERIAALTDLQKAMERMAREVRVADPLLAASATEFQGQIYRGGDRLKYRYWLSGGSIHERVEVFSGGAWTVRSDQVFVADVVGGGVFTYQDEFGNDITAALGGGGSSLNDVARVVIHVRRDLPEQGPIEMQTLVLLRNAGY